MRHDDAEGDGGTRLAQLRSVRVAGTCLVFAISGCASSAPLRMVPPPPPTNQEQRPPRVDLSSREVALFVRDSTERGLTLASLLMTALRRRGVECRLVVSQSAPAPSWSIDDSQARQSGAPYAARVTVVTRTETNQQIHRRDLATERATGIVIGPTYDAAPIDFPELATPGGLERRDVGGAETEQDLRLEVMASLRRVGWEQPIGRWSATEATLRRLGVTLAPRATDPWPLVYEAVANRLADLIFDRLIRDPK